MITYAGYGLFNLVLSFLPAKVRYVNRLYVEQLGSWPILFFSLETSLVHLVLPPIEGDSFVFFWLIQVENIPSSPRKFSETAWGCGYWLLRQEEKTFILNSPRKFSNILLLLLIKLNISLLDSVRSIFLVLEGFQLAWHNSLCFFLLLLLASSRSWHIMELCCWFQDIKLTSSIPSINTEG